MIWNPPRLSKRLGFLGLFVAMLAHGLLIHAAEPAAGRAERPNILFIMTDQQHAGMMSCTGNAYLRTPALDALAAGGVRFERAYATNPVCVPSRFSLQTGRMPSAIRMGTNEPQLDVPPRMRAESLGPLLRRAGYHCVYGGKDHTPTALSQYMMKEGYENLTKDSRDELAKVCADFIRKPHDRPFFLFASFINPHDICYMVLNDFRPRQGKPIYDNVDARYCEFWLDKARASGDLETFVREHCPPLPDNFEVPEKEPDGIDIDYVGLKSPRRYSREQWSERMWRLHRWLYCRLTESVDAQIGVVLRALEEAGLERNTLVIFTSDHGDMDSAHRLEHKGVLYEESIRIPFIMSWKGRIPSARVDAVHLVSNGLDLLPTLCDYAGIERPAGLAGRSLRPLVEDRATAAWRDHVVVESRNGRSVRTANFKYTVYENGTRREMLVDLRSDPGEMNNLADVPEYAQEIERHRRLLFDWVRQCDDQLARSYIILPAGETRPASQPSMRP